METLAGERAGSETTRERQRDRDGERRGGGEREIVSVYELACIRAVACTQKHFL